MPNRFGEVSQHTFHDHAAVREFMIRAALADATAPIVVLGDSITEMAPLPRPGAKLPDGIHFTAAA
ncbi:hypothetical protein [Bradyrhizobium sp. Ce-3]|uniref:hypothetical protein n=1 Tax=Bradyrhizobium sp. Ce-3 TaxID=2913970 RepID=UPI001FBB304F|nr:hypothetical protein [Bradyrhizobium sp. Ce-3]